VWNSAPLYAFMLRFAGATVNLQGFLNKSAHWILCTFIASWNPKPQHRVQEPTTGHYCKRVQTHFSPQKFLLSTIDSNTNPSVCLHLLNSLVSRNFRNKIFLACFVSPIRDNEPSFFNDPHITWIPTNDMSFHSNIFFSTKFSEALT